MQNNSPKQQPYFRRGQTKPVKRITNDVSGLKTKANRIDQISSELQEINKKIVDLKKDTLSDKSFFESEPQGKIYSLHSINLRYLFTSEQQKKSEKRLKVLLEGNDYFYNFINEIVLTENKDLKKK